MTSRGRFLGMLFESTQKAVSLVQEQLGGHGGGLGARREAAGSQKQARPSRQKRRRDPLGEVFPNGCSSVMAFSWPLSPLLAKNNPLQLRAEFPQGKPAVVATAAAAAATKQDALSTSRFPSPQTTSVCFQAAAGARLAGCWIQQPCAWGWGGGERQSTGLLRDGGV